MFKYIYITIFLCVFLHAQDTKPRKNMQVMMKWQLTEYLDLGENQAEKFFPKMNTYEKNIKQINSKIKALRDTLEKQINTSSTSNMQNRNNIKEIKELEKQKIDLRAEYYLSLEGILEPNQVSKLMIFEKKFRKTLKDKLKKAPNRNKKNKYNNR